MGLKTSLRALMVMMGLKKRKTTMLLVGLANSGKSTIVAHLNAASKDEAVPTAGFNIERLDFDKSKLKLMDMSGQDKYQLLWEHFYKDANCIVYVIDAADVKQLETSRQVLLKLLRHEHLRGKPLLVFCNKVDLPQSLGLQQMADFLQLDKQLLNVYHVQTCSALRGDGIEEGIRWLMQVSK